MDFGCSGQLRDLFHIMRLTCQGHGAAAYPTSPQPSGVVPCLVTLQPLRYSFDARLLAKNLQTTIVLVEEPVLTLHLLDAVLVQIWQFLRGLDIIHVLHVTLREDQVDLFK